LLVSLKGYGVLTPITTEGQLFCIFFAFISIPFTGLLAAKIGWVMAYYIKEASNTSSGCFVMMISECPGQQLR